MLNEPAQQPDTVLIVDDTPHNIRLLESILVTDGYQVRVAKSGEMALKSVVIDPPDLILLDIRMPGMDGIQVCEQLKISEHSRDIPIVFLSALNDPDSKVRAFSAGGIDYVTKPFDSDEILARVRIHLQLRKLQRAMALQNQELLRAKESLQQERNFINTILDTVAALVMVLDSEGRILRFNHACEAVAGYSEAEMRGQDIELLLLEEASVGSKEVGDVFRRLRHQIEPVSFENTWRHRNGSQRRIAWKNNVLTDIDGNVEYVIATGIDVTDQRQAQAQARQHVEELAHMHRLHTAGELATMLAHEINQPLLAISSYSEAAQQILARPEPNVEKLRYNLEQVGQQALRAGRTIRQLRNFVSRGHIDPSPVDLNAIVQSVQELMYNRLLSRDIRLVTELAPHLGPVLAVDVQVEQILINLIRNAVDAIRDAKMSGGLVTLRTAEVDGMARISIEDSGPGIDAERASELFEPFRSSKDYGLGVGLRICRSLVEAHNGRIWVEPMIPGGRFHFTLPTVAP